MKPGRLQEKEARGITLIELTLIIGALLGLVSLLFVSLRTYKRRSDRVHCVRNISRVQTAMRIHCNIYQLDPGSPAPNLKARLVGPDSYFPTEPHCPAGGAYSWGEGTVPLVGIQLLNCSITGHEPLSEENW